MIDLGVWGVIEAGIKYAVVPLVIMGWHMYKRLEQRMDSAEKRISEHDKIMVKLETILGYMEKQLEDIKDILSNNQKYDNHHSKK